MLICLISSRVLTNVFELSFSIIPTASVLLWITVKEREDL